VGEHNVIEAGGFTETEMTGQAEFCIACLHWLVDAGYVTGKPHTRGLQDAVLTAKGLETLKAVPDSLTPSAPPGERMMQAAKTEGKNALRTLVNQALGVGLQVLAR